MAEGRLERVYVYLWLAAPAAKSFLQRSGTAALGRLAPSDKSSKGITLWVGMMIKGHPPLLDTIAKPPPALPNLHSQSRHHQHSP